MIGYLRSMLVATFAAGLVFAGPTASARADVRDDAGYFSKQTIAKANDIIDDIRKETSKDVVMETFAEAPNKWKESLTGPNGKKALEDWAAERARERKVNGVYILMCKEPRRLQVEAGFETRKKAFTLADADKLFTVFRDQFKDGKFDEGLIAGLRFTQDRMKENLKGVKITPAAGNDYIRDQGKYFSDNAQRKASDIIADIHKRWGKDVIIETFMKKPAGEANVGDWAKRRAQERNANGVYILMCKEGKALQVDAGADTRKKAFTFADTERLHDLMVGDFKKDRFDEGLVSGVEFIRDTMKKNLGSSAAPSPSAAPSSTNTHRGGTTMGGGIPWMGLLCAGLVIIGVLWLVIGLVRAFTSRGSYGPGPGGPGGGGYGPGYGGGGGGGFMTGLMGGLFGAVAGSWLYNQFSGSHGSNFGSSTAYGSSSTPTGTDDGGTLRSDDGRDFAGTGGSYGDDSGGSGGGGDSGGGAGGDYGGDSGGGSGGDYGGDSGGGGDFGGGGGDFGGGGGDFGGGGGDF